MKGRSAAIGSLIVTATLGLGAGTAAAQGSMRLDRSLPSNEAPAILKDVTVEQRMDAQVPLDLPFRDETGREVRLADYFNRKKPVLLVPAYYECPMLCTQVLNSVFTQIKVITLDPGAEYELVVLSFDPKEPPALARDKKAAYVDHYNRPGTEGGIHFLTGPQSSIEPVLQAVGFKYRYDPAIDQYAHPATIVVLTPDGRVSKYFLGIDYSARDLRFAMLEASEGHIGSAIERAVITWCYHYDPSTGKYGLLTLRLVQAGGILTVLALATFWIVMWRRGLSAAGAGRGPGATAASYGR